MGRIELICGCMFSGKTTELIGRLIGTPEANVLVVKHSIDNRYLPNHIVTHDGRKRRARVVSSSAELRVAANGVSVLAIDEGHFFDAALPDVCRELADRHLRVIVTALDRDSWGRNFPIIDRLREVADEVEVKRGRCAQCGAPADHTQRLTPIINGDLIGGADDYAPSCADCFAPPKEPPPST